MGRGPRMLARLPPTAAAAGGGGAGTALLGLLLRYASTPPQPPPIPRNSEDDREEGRHFDLDDLLASWEFRLGFLLGASWTTLVEGLQVVQLRVRDFLAALVRPAPPAPRRGLPALYA